jgi:hypothetical protein
LRYAAGLVLLAAAVAGLRAGPEHRAFACTPAADFDPIRSSDVILEGVLGHLPGRSGSDWRTGIGVAVRQVYKGEVEDAWVEFNPGGHTASCGLGILYSGHHAGERGYDTATARLARRLGPPRQPYAVRVLRRADAVFTPFA